ncbi:iron complex transport system permease protein [Kytococcus aerolatus]|uniref:Iron complex transport system permease protein n=1 Tax=Kytococcus aerolatus TaxID=592308 RepID=A0A212TZH2_9MICO|nr:iron ABC transporter permease [Kytococcus aerolatus]SNC71403.1 iron complex transport system permease protein [Kytococcus aerolatus]
MSREGTLVPSREGESSATPQGRRRSRVLRTLVLGGLVATLLVTCWLSITIGSRAVTLDAVWAALNGRAEGFDEAAVAKRIPRTGLAVIAGASLAVSGLAMQAVTRNPLADPGILGVNAGASLAVTTGIAWFGLALPTSFIWVAIAGAGLTAVIVYLVGSLGAGGPTPLKLTLAGAAFTIALSAFVSAVVLPRQDIGMNVISWQIGGVGGATQAVLVRVLPFLLVGLVLAWLMARGMNTLGLGDEMAASLGERVWTTRLLASAAAVVLCGATTAVAGPIGFVGLVVPHTCRMLAGVDHRWLVPYSAVGGAILLTGADVLGRVVHPPAEMDVGIITALVGAPVFIAIVRRRTVREL